MRTIPPERFRIRVRIANHHPVARGQGWGPRTIPDLQFLCPLAGRYRYADDAETVEVAPGQVLCIEPDRRHTLSLLGSAAGELSTIHGELSEGSWSAGEYRSDPPPARVTTPAESALVAQRFRDCAAVFAGYGRLRQALCDTIATEIVLRLAERWRATATPATSARVAAMVAFIRDHAVRGCSRHQLARAFGVTPEHINAVFRRELQLTPSAVLNRERCRIAYRLLHDEGLTVAEAAERAGYRDAFYFSRVFTRLYQRPPGRCRMRA